MAINWKIGDRVRFILYPITMSKNYVVEEMIDEDWSGYDDLTCEILNAYDGVVELKFADGKVIICGNQHIG